MKKAYIDNYPPGSPEHTVLHGDWQRGRGRQPSKSYKGIRNPQKAYEAATTDIFENPLGTLRLEQGTMKQVTEFAGDPGCVEVDYDSLEVGQEVIFETGHGLTTVRLTAVEFGFPTYANFKGHYPPSRFFEGEAIKSDYHRLEDGGEVFGAAFPDKSILLVTHGPES